MEVKIKLRGNVLGKRKIQFANLSKTAAELFSKELRSAINMRTSGAGSGKLANSIQPVMRGNRKYGVKGAYYFWYANYGRSPGKPPGKRVDKIDAWARKVGWTGSALRRHIAEFGTNPTLFYETAKKMFKSKRKRIYKNIFKNKR